MLVCYLDIYLNHDSLLTNKAFVGMTYVYSNTPFQLRHTSKVIIRDIYASPISQTPNTKLKLKINTKHISSTEASLLLFKSFYFLLRCKEKTLLENRNQ